jgi:hypothetical protein
MILSENRYSLFRDHNPAQSLKMLTGAGTDTSASESKQRPGFGRCGRAPAIFGTGLASHLHELGVAASEAILPGANIVLETGAHSIAIPLHRPTHDFRLMTPDPGRRPSRVGENALEFAMQ